ncbi:MAG: 2,3-bisphosphoglycerate-dependent phosphoglycerate mutase [Chlamydiota bacterium]
MAEKATVLTLLRHGQSEWNKRNLFTGWVDVPLSTEGIEEALQAGEQIRTIPFGAVFISALMRAQMTALLALSRHKMTKTPVRLNLEDEKLQEWGKISDPKLAHDCLPIYSAWELNERMYGELQGMNKDEARRQFGVEQVHTWRRSYDIAPPGGESLKETAKRVLPYFKKGIVPHLERGEHVLVSAHGNSLRAVMMMLEELSEDEVVQLEIPTGEPLCYRYFEGEWERMTLKAIGAEFKETCNE